jgi:uncharacterized membrane protein
MATLLTVINVLLQIGYPLSAGSTRHGLTIASVVVFFCASLAHCVGTRSWRCGLVLVTVCVGGGLVAEALGWRTGWPFGSYRYGSTLGPKLLGVPMVVPLAWAMMGWPALLAGRRVGQRWVDRRGVSEPDCRISGADGEATVLSGRKVRVITAVVGSLVLTSWDLFLDPQMVGAGHWRWLPTSGPWLNGIPLLNTAGWFVIGVLMIATLDAVIPNDGTPPVADALIWVVLGWVWFSNIVGHLVFFDRPWVALAGGAASTVIAGIVVGRSALLSARRSSSRFGRRR